jgi:hypothetical protein
MGAAVASYALRLLNDLISPREERGGHIEPEGLRGLQVDHQLVAGRRLHREVGGLRPLQDAVHVFGCLSVLVDEISSKRDEAAGSNEMPVELDSRQLILGCERNDQLAMYGCQCTAGHDDAAIRHPGECSNISLNVISISHPDGG